AVQTALRHGLHEGVAHIGLGERTLVGFDQRRYAALDAALGLGAFLRTLCRSRRRRRRHVVVLTVPAAAGGAGERERGEQRERDHSAHASPPVSADSSAK